MKHRKVTVAKEAFSRTGDCHDPSLKAHEFDVVVEEDPDGFSESKSLGGRSCLSTDRVMGKC